MIDHAIAEFDMELLYRRLDRDIAANRRKLRAAVLASDHRKVAACTAAHRKFNALSAIVERRIGGPGANFTE